MPPYDDLLFVPATPVVRHPDRQQSIGSVPILIDSGADATSMQRSASRLSGSRGLVSALDKAANTVSRDDLS